MSTPTPPAIAATTAVSEQQTSTTPAAASTEEPEKPTIPIAADPNRATRANIHDNANSTPLSAPQEETLPSPAPAPPTLDDLKAQKIATITAHNASLTASIASTRAQLEALTATLKHAPAATVKTHIELLHAYNEIRDVGQGLLGMIAENRGVRVGELYGEFGVGGGD